MSILRATFSINADTRVPAVGFGTYLIGEGDVSEAVRAAIGVGYRHIDTAEVYQNEEGVGEGIRVGLRDNGLSRNDIFVTTKLWPGASEWGEVPKTGEQTMMSCEASLKRLGLDHVDLYLIHSPHGGQQRVNQWRALLELKRAGKARGIGVSNYSAKHLDEIDAAGLPMPEANQIELHPWSQKPALVAYMRQRSIAPIAYSSLAPLSTWRAAPRQDSAKPQSPDADSGFLAGIAARYGVTEAQLLLKWGVQNGYAVLPKSLNPERMRQNIDLDGFTIEAPDLEAIALMDRGGGIAWSMGDPTKVS
ncbi:2,5-diketo-D-gluconic acid reductase [Azorhizobium oxalatiphilum]|uniref:2,5-diketo-D-gluconic acid reductase n=1 Tax=Azorhizobium oxalatiphilum TaxID=980631 RepID=A0A917C528_9HYPH|nr:aldo/keto reductase [Azorhizobium oxalatiphilum]GGF71121.1 2,5-diketo-D-gluconic acid reductase [Azorhizobium oxalatiphilum]